MYAKDDNGNSVIFQTPDNVEIINARIESKLGETCHVCADIAPKYNEGKIFTVTIETPNIEPVLENEFNSILEEN